MAHFIHATQVVSLSTIYVLVLKRTWLCMMTMMTMMMNDVNSLGTLTTDATSQLDVLGHDCHTLSVDSAQVGVFKQTNQVRLTGLLQRHNGRALETQVSLEILGNLTDQTLERELTDEKLCALLVSPDLTEGHSSGPVTMRLLHAAGGRCALASSLCGQLLAGSLSSRTLTCGLLCTRHFKSEQTLIRHGLRFTSIYQFSNDAPPPSVVYGTLLVRMRISL